MSQFLSHHDETSRSTAFGSSAPGSASSRGASGTEASQRKSDYTSLILALSHAKRDSSQGKATRVFTATLFGIFVLMLLLAFLAGVTVYKNLSTAQSTLNNYRSSESLIVNNVLANDSYETLRQGKGPEGKSLVMVESNDDGTYETRIYLYQGIIMEEYAVLGAPYSPETATPLATSKVFSFTLSNNLLRITTNHGTAEVAVRCMEGAA